MKFLKPSATRHWKLTTSLIGASLALSVGLHLSGWSIPALAALLVAAFLAAQWFMIDPPDVDEPAEEETSQPGSRPDNPRA